MNVLLLILITSISPLNNSLAKENRFFLLTLLTQIVLYY